MSQAPHHFFISYDDSDEAFVRRLVADLSKAGITTLRYEQQARISRDWLDNARRALAVTWGVILIGSPSAGESPAVDEELTLAHGLGSPVIAVWADGDVWSQCAPSKWKDAPHIDCRGDRYDAALPTVLGQLRAVISASSDVPTDIPAATMDQSPALAPGTYFISHAYRDTRPLRTLLAHLPPGVKPHIFPPIQVSPVEYVSNPLLEALVASDGVIVLRGRYSDESFWVAFERDYALRRDKPVFGFDPMTKRFERLALGPHDPVTLPLAVHCFLGKGSGRAKGLTVLNFLTKERLFNPEAEGGSWMGALNLMRNGGYLVILVDDPARWEEHYRDLTDSYPRERLILAMLSDGPAPETYDPDLVIRLYDGDADGRLDSHRIDDLVVRLYWMIYRNRTTLSAHGAPPRLPATAALANLVRRALGGASREDAWRKPTAK